MINKWERYMKKLNRFSLFVLLFLFSKLTLAADYTFKYGTVSADTEPLLDAMRYMAKNIEDRSNDRIKIDVYGGAVLGTNKEVYEQVKNGAMVMTIADAGYLSDYYPDLGVLNGPYLLGDIADFDKILKSDWYKTSLEKLTEASDIKVTAFNWLFGARHIITDKPIRSPADMKDVAIRVPPNTMWVETFKSMGAKGTQVAWAEVYGALSTGLVDAAEAPIASIIGAKLYEQKKVISMTGHFKAFVAPMMNAKIFDSMPNDLQQIIMEESINAGKYLTKLTLEGEEERIKQLEAEGITFVRSSEIDIPAFQKATAPTYNAFPEWSEGLYETVQSILK
jgi:tripartite ATP-independent transporter DctP family solute receptor